MDKNFFFVYYFVMEFYYNPNVCILYMKRCVLGEWHGNHPKLGFWRLYWHNARGAIIRHNKQAVELTPERIVLVPPNTELIQRLDRGPAMHFGVHFLTDAPFNRLHSKIYVFKAEAGILSNTIKNLSSDDEDGRLINNPPQKLPP